MSLSKKYTLDRIEEGMYVFLEAPEEMNQLILPTSTFDLELNEGDIVNITTTDEGYQLEVLKEETLARRKEISALLEDLINRNK
ncbi:DUF3006 domain-containing protein [Psychrobacillus sp. MER TA 171]|uniref:DUF3006 domain-containing protein n=1 Tax=Psychrobacillus sp. MER TA 171 TaxID=2939577 RepID=UPI002040AD7D|nr:DUF3006 domain-containing protein [Psychrobacillus sp. MER TA 171]